MRAFNKNSRNIRNMNHRSAYKNTKQFTAPSQQSGAVLIVSMILLLVLTILVLTGNRRVLMQEKMTAAVRDSHVSLAVAESGLRDGETYADSLTSITGFNATCNNGLCSLNNGPADLFADAVWGDANKTRAGTVVDGVAPRFFLVDLGIMTEGGDAGGINMMGYGETEGGGTVRLFQIVSRAAGKSGHAERVVISLYGVRL